jgi:hypothetical protein
MADGWECYHCKQWVEKGAPHDCWTTTEAALTAGLSEDLQDAWERLRESAVELGEQRIYASHNSIMFSRKSCYFFVRPKRSYLEVCVFLPRPVKAPQIKRAVPASRTKVANLIQIRHRDEVEAPITDWLQEAYEFSVAQKPPVVKTSKKAAGKKAARKKAVRRAPLSGAPMKTRAVARKKSARKSAKKR